MTTKNDIEKKLEELTRAFGSEDSVVHQVMSRLEEKPAPKDSTAGSTAVIRRLVMNRFTKLAAAAAVLIALLIVMDYIGSPGGGLAFGEVLEKIASVQTAHFKLNEGGRLQEVWAKRPNMLRIESLDGTTVIANGPTEWVVKPKLNKATKQAARYYSYARERDLDVLDLFFEMPYSDDFSGFFSEQPVGQVVQEGRIFDLYQTQIEQEKLKIYFKALVDAQTHLLHSMGIQKKEDRDNGAEEDVWELTVLEYDMPLSAEMFAFEPPPDMEIVVKEPKPEDEDDQHDLAATESKGSTLSGKIFWESSGKPVGGARLTFSGGYDPQTNQILQFHAKAETDRDGYWQLRGVPAGNINIRVRSWELEWPAVPTFGENIAPLLTRITVDGQSRYDGLDFKVYKPEDFYARITINVTDEDGNPIEGINGVLSAADDSSMYNQHICPAPHQQYTGPDGRFDADIWPTTGPVGLYLGHRDGPNCPYVTRNIQVEPFKVESRESYLFDIVLPYKRDYVIKVVDPAGRPVEGLSAVLFDFDRRLVFPYADEPAPIFTDNDGTVTVTNMVPGERLLLTLKRMRPDVADLLEDRKPLSSAAIPVTVPQAGESPLIQVTCDERPIRIEVDVDSLPTRPSWVFVAVLGKPRLFAPFVDGTGTPDGKFVLEGVPAGKIGIACGIRQGRHSYEFIDGFIRTEPGHAYCVKFTQGGPQVIKEAPIP